MDWSAASAIGQVLASWILVEIVLAIAKETPKWLGFHVLGTIRRHSKELWHLRGLTHDDRFVRWRPGAHRYVALQAIKAQVDSHPSPPQPLLDLLSEQIREGRSVVVVGEPGSGKTTALEAITYLLARRAYHRSVVVWLSAVGITAALTYWSLAGALLLLGVFMIVASRVRLWITPFFLELRYFYSDDAHTFLAGAMKESLGDDKLLERKGRCVFLLDGANEIQRLNATKFADTWRNQKRPPLGVFAARMDEIPALGVATTLEVRELDDAGVTAFVDVYVRENRQISTASVASHEVAHTVGAEFGELQRLGLLGSGGVGRNPYWLRMLVVGGLHTRNRGALFLSFSHQLISREIEGKMEERKRNWTPVPVNWEMEALGSLALAMNRQQGVGLKGKREWEHARRTIKEALVGRRETADDVLAEAEAATLLRSRDMESVDFSHQLVQEFFAAYALRSEERWNEAIGYCEHVWWWQTLFLLGGLTDVAMAGGSSVAWASFMERLVGDGSNDMRLFVAIGLLRNVENPDLRVTHRVLQAFDASVGERLTSRQEEAVRGLERILGDEAIDEFRVLLNDSQKSINTKGAVLLCACRGVRASEILLAAFRKPDERTRVGQALASVGSPAVDILGRALRDEQPDLRADAAALLGSIPDPRAIKLLVAALNDVDYSTRKNAVDALGKIGDEGAIDPIMTVRPTRDIEMRKAVEAALGQIGQREFQSLCGALRDPDSSIRRRSAEVLGLTGKAEIIDAIVPLLRDPDPSVRFQVAVALGRIEEERVVEPLIVALKDVDKGVRRQAVLGLRGQRGASAAEALIAAVNDSDHSVRLLALAAVARVSDPHAIGQLIRLLSDGGEPEHGRAISALEQQGERAVESLIPALQDGSSSVRWGAAEALGRIGDVRASDALRIALGDQHKSVRRHAAKALGEIGDVRGVSELNHALGDNDKAVGVEAAVALGRLGDVRAVGPLSRALHIGHRDVRLAAAVALGRIGDARAVDGLADALRDSDISVAKEAAKALGQIGEPRAVEPLVIAARHALLSAAAIEALRRIQNPETFRFFVADLTNTHTSNRAQAAKALGCLGDRAAVEPLIAALQEPDASVRRSAAEALGRLGDHRADGPLKAAFDDLDDSVRQEAARALAKLAEVETHKF